MSLLSRWFNGTNAVKLNNQSLQANTTVTSVGAGNAGSSGVITTSTPLQIGAANGAIMGTMNASNCGCGAFGPCQTHGTITTTGTSSAASSAAASSFLCTCNALKGIAGCPMHNGMGVINFPSVSTGGIIWGSGGLTSEEQRELDLLRADFNAELKQIRKNHFKELPLYKRETILIMAQCSKIVKDIGAHSPQMSTRQSELESKSGNIVKIWHPHLILS